MSTKLSGGAIAGIVIGCVCFALLVAALVAYWAFGMCGEDANSSAGKTGTRTQVPTQDCEQGVAMT
jgi:hypothetical protein